MVNKCIYENMLYKTDTKVKKNYVHLGKRLKLHVNIITNATVSVVLAMRCSGIFASLQKIL